MRKIFLALFFVFAFMPNVFGACATYGEYKYGDQCVPCTPGYRCYNGSRALCTYGMFSGAGQGHCTACPAGTTTTFLGATSIDDCVPCPNSANVAQWTSVTVDTSSTSGVENSCKIKKCNVGYYLIETIGEENLFDISKVVDSANLTHTENSITSTGFPAYLGSRLNVLCPQCETGKYYLLSYDSDNGNSNIFLIKGSAERYFWGDGKVLQINDKMLGASWGFYTGTYNNVSIREYSSECVACPENTYGSNGKCSPCPTGLVSPMGSKDSGSCGRKLHIGDEILYLRSSKKTTPSLNIDINNDGIADFFGNATLQRTTINSSSQRYLHVGEYYIYDDTISPNE